MVPPSCRKDRSSRNRILHSVAMLLGLLVILNGSQCYVAYTYDDDDCFDDDDDDFDDDCDDDDDDFSAANHGNAVLSDYVLRHYRLVSAQDPERHPVASLVDIEGASLFRMLGRRQYGDREIELFTSRILAANEKLLGLPPDAGWLAFREVAYHETWFVVIYQQGVTDAAGKPTPISGGEVQFLFDMLGDLHQICNSTFLSPSAVPARPATDPAPAATPSPPVEGE